MESIGDVCAVLFLMGAGIAAVALWEALRGARCKGGTAAGGKRRGKIDNFSFGPATVTVPAGTNGDVDESRRHSTHSGERRQKCSNRR